MRADIRDEATFRSLAPLDVARYLRARGWNRFDEIGDRASVWSPGSEDAEEVEVLLPLDRSLGDYALRMGEVVRTLERVEARSQLEIVHDIVTTDADIVRVRLHASEKSNHTLPIEDAVLAAEKSRDMMLAAACSAVEPREYYHARKFDQANAYVRRLRLGQTEPGSFIFTLISPVPPALSSDTQLPLLPGDDETDTPFERRVTRTLITGLNSAQKAARDAASSGDISPFVRAVNDGVSANLCDALQGLAGADGSAAFEVGLSWSSNRTAPRDICRSVRFTPDVLPVFEEVSRQFKKKRPQEEFELEGVIVQMEQQEDPDGDRRVRISGAVEGKTRKVEVTLPRDDFSRAIQAFEGRETVRVLGKLTRSGRRYVLENPRQFEVLPEE